jgi:group I intron endonuclease
MICYQITNLINDKRYIGYTTRSIEERWYRHIANSKVRKTALYLAINKYGVDNFIIEEIAFAKTVEDVKLLEIDLIAQEQTLVPNGYNMTIGGDGGFNEEHMQKLIALHTGSQHTKEHRKKISQSMTGKKRPKLTGKFTYNGNPFFGKKHSAETKAKMRESRLKYLQTKTQAQVLINSLKENNHA